MEPSFFRLSRFLMVVFAEFEANLFYEVNFGLAVLSLVLQVFWLLQAP